MLVEDIKYLFTIMIDRNNTDQELITQASDQLMKYYEDPNTLSVLFDLFSDSGQSISMYIMCAIGMKHMFFNQLVWNSFIEAGSSEQIKTRILEMIQTTTNKYIRKNIMVCLDGIMKTEAKCWPEYIDLINILFSTNDINNVELGLQLADKLLVDDSELENEFILKICQQIERAYSVEDPDLLITSSLVLEHVFTVAPEMQEVLLQLYHLLLNHMVQLMTNDDAAFLKLLDNLTAITGSEFEFLDPTQMISQLLEIAINEEINPNNRCLVFNVICGFISSNHKAIHSCIPDLIKYAFLVSVPLFIENESLDSQEDIRVVMECITALASVSKQKYVFSVLFETMSVETIPLLAVSGIALLALIEEAVEVVNQNITDVVDFAFQCVRSSNYCVIETGFELFSRMITRPNEYFSEIAVDLLSVIMEALKVPNEHIIKSSILALCQFAEVIGIGNRNFVEVFQVLVGIYEEYPLYLQGYVFDCFAKIARSASEDLYLISETLLPLALQCSQLQDTQEALMLKTSGIECIGILMRYTPTQTQEIANDAINLFIQYISMTDDPALSSVAMIALKDVIYGGYDISGVFDTIINSILSILQKEIEHGDDENEETNYQNTLIEDSFVFTLNLLSAIAKKLPNFVIPFIPQFKPILSTLIEKSNENDIIISAIKAITYLHSLVPCEDKEFYMLFIDYFDSDPETASQLFSSLGYLLSHNYPVPTEVVAAMCEYGYTGMERELSFQIDNSNYNIDFGGHLYLFFKIVARKCPEAFDGMKFWNKIQDIIKNEENGFETVECAGVLAEYFVSCHETIPSLLKQSIVKFFFDCITKYCDFEFPPDPIAAIRYCIETEPKYFDKNRLTTLMSIIDEMLQEEYYGQLMYNITMDYVVSLLFSVFRCIEHEAFPVDIYMERMLKALPPLSCREDEAENIYFSIVFVCGEYPQLMGKFGVMISVLFIQTFGLKEKNWKDMGLSQGCLSAMSVLLNNLLSSNPQSAEIIALATDNNQACSDRFNERFQYYFGLSTEA